MEDIVQENCKVKKVISRPPDIMSDDRVFLAWQRSHMANERTFLAWSRTSVSLLAFGFVVEKFDIFLEYVMRLGGLNIAVHGHQSMTYLSLFCFSLAGLSTLFAGMRFLQVRRHINSGDPVFSIIPDVLVVVSVLVIIIMTIILTLPRLMEMGMVPA